MTQDEFERKTYRKHQLETEVQGTTEERKREIETELGQINADLEAHARLSVPRQQPARRDAPGT